MNNAPSLSALMDFSLLLATHSWLKLHQRLFLQSDWNHPNASFKIPQDSDVLSHHFYFILVYSSLLHVKFLIKIKIRYLIYLRYLILKIRYLIFLKKVFSYFFLIPNSDPLIFVILFRVEQNSYTMQVIKA